MRASRALVGVAAAALLAAFPEVPAAQEITIDLGDGTSLAQRGLILGLAVAGLSLLPGAIVMVTCFPFIVTVLSILRQGIGLQSAPPNMLIVGLALFLTYFVMEPVILDAWQGGVSPFLEGRLQAAAAFEETMRPFRTFMAARVDPDTLAALADLRSGPPLTADQTPLSLLVPSFILSEIALAFQIGFLIYLPFLVIDLVVAAILMSMGMMMVPPAMVALPFKLAFFVVADGWSLVAKALVQSYG